MQPTSPASCPAAPLSRHPFNCPPSSCSFQRGLPTSLAYLADADAAQRGQRALIPRLRARLAAKGAHEAGQGEAFLCRRVAGCQGILIDLLSAKGAGVGRWTCVCAYVDGKGGGAPVKAGPFKAEHSPVSCSRLAT